MGDVYFANSRPFEYFDEPEKTKNAFNEQGWSTMGDVGYLDEEGFCTSPTARISPLSLGCERHPAEIEGLLTRMRRLPMWRFWDSPSRVWRRGHGAVPLVGLMQTETEAELLSGCESALTVKVPRRSTSSSNSPEWITASFTSATFRMRIAKRGNASCQAVTYSGEPLCDAG